MPNITAQELLAQLDERYRTDPEYRLAVDTRNARLAEIAVDRARRLAPFTEALKNAGVTETSDRMSGLKHADPRIFQIAFEHLERDGYDDWTRATIARHFETRGAAPHWNRLKVLYLDARGGDEREHLATQA